MQPSLIFAIVLACGTSAGAQRHGGVTTRFHHHGVSRRNDLESPPHNDGDVLVQIKPLDSDGDSVQSSASATGSTASSAQWLSYAGIGSSSSTTGTVAVNFAAGDSTQGQTAQSGVEGAQSYTTQPPTETGCLAANSDEDPGPVTQKEVDQWLKAHNEARSAHGAGELKWRADLAWGAKTNAERCQPGHTSIGENIATSTVSMSPEQAVAQWMENAGLWSGDYAEETAHFSQVVWKASRSVGCYIQACDPGTRYSLEYGDSWVATCRYDPPGNNDAGSAMLDNVQ